MPWTLRSSRRSRPTPTSTSRTTCGSIGSTRASATGRPGGFRPSKRAAGAWWSTTTPWAGRTSPPTTPEPRSQRGSRLRAPDVRFEMMRTDDVNAEIIYPTIGLYVWNIADPAVGRVLRHLQRLGARAPCGHRADQARGDDPHVGRRHGDRGSAARRAERLGRRLAPALVGTPEWNLPTWEPLWTAIQETGIPAVMHQGTGHDMIFYRGWGSATANLLATQSMAPRGPRC